MSVDAAALISLLRPLIDRAQPAWKKEEDALRRRFLNETTRAIADHHGFVSRWCQESHGVLFAGVDADAPTVELSFRSIPRRVGIAGKELDELDVLVSSDHIAVLGDPGAGKTTTLRRLAKFVALEPETWVDDDWRFVVVVVCRDERWDTDSIYDVLGRKVGITDKLARDLDNPPSRIREVLDVGALVIIDGLDEVPPRHRAELERGIAQLGRHLARSKIIVSCRSADYVAPLGGFQIAEIRPLTPDQIKQVVDLLLGEADAAAFYEAVQAPDHPVAELANRPLFLMQMVAIYKRRGTIPDRPVDLYEAIVRLVIQEWDELRGVRRVSKYGQFGVDDKRRFLADLAYELIRADLIRFDENDLSEMYASLAERYGLPKAEARMVARELESHTGLLVESGEFYEFSHLSLQEFLAGDSMVRGAANANDDWWSTYPSVAAVATAMSSDANAWFSELMAKMPRDVDEFRPVHAFLHRLGQERPRFVRSTQLGVEFLRLLFRARVSDPEVVARLSKLKSIRNSVFDALLAFDTIHIGPDTTRLSRHADGSQVASEALAVSTPVLAALVGPDRLRELKKDR